MSSALPESTQLNTPELLEAFFERSQDGFFFMMLDQPVEWGPGVDKEAVLDYVFSHQRMTKVNPAMALQFRASPAALLGLTPSDFFRHDLAGGRRGWRALFDSGHTHSVTNERRIDETMQIVRRIASELRPSVLDQLGLEAAIEFLVRDTAQRTGIAITLHADDFPRLPDEIASHAFRIIQEALTNVTRHSQATRVDVSVRRAGPVIILGVEDNGVGFTPQSLTGLRSLGLVGIRERALACGGTLMIRGEPGQGTGIAVTIPVAQP